MPIIEEAIKQAMKNMLVKSGYDVKSVLSYQDETESTGYCDSCYYEYAVVDINYITQDNVNRTYRYNGNFSDLINTLDQNS